MCWMRRRDITFPDKKDFIVLLKGTSTSLLMIYLYVLAVCRETFCLGNDFSKPPRPPCSHTLHNMLLKQTIKLSCLTTHLSPLYPRCLFNHAVSVTHPCISAQMCSRIIMRPEPSKTFTAAVFRMKRGAALNR